MSKVNVYDLLSQARVFELDHKHKLILVWYGGHGVHVYNRYGRLMPNAYFSIGPFDRDLNENEVRRAMANMIITEYDGLLS